MKRKRSAALSLAGPRWDAAMAAVFSVLLFFAMHVSAEPFSVGMAFIALALCVGRTPWRLARERFCVPVVGFLVFIVLYGISAISSPFGGTAAREFSWILAAFAISALVLFRVERRHVQGLLWGFAAVCAIVSLLCTSCSCEGPLYGAFGDLMKSLGSGDLYISEIEEINGRVNGIYNDANVSGSILALGALVSLYLVQTAKQWWKRLLACLLVSTSAVGIFLSVSRGAMLFFGLALLAWLLAAGREYRIRLFLLMVESALVCFAVFMPASEAVAPGAVLPNILAVVSGAVIYLLDWAVGNRLAALLGRHWKLAAVSAAGVVLAVGVFAIAALTLTKPYVFEARDSFLRGVKLEGGVYTLDQDWSDEESHWTNVYGFSREGLLTGERIEIYNGPSGEMSFTVPDNAVWVFFRFWGDAGDTLRSARLSDGTAIPMDYRFLPAVLADRLQRGIFSDNSYLLRVQYLKDAWVLFVRSPLVGHGLGASDNLYPAVQPFYYQSRYVHNHVLQVMVNQGLLGALPYVAFLGGVLWLLLKQLRKERDPLAAFLLACWVMMNSHSLIEINFCLQAYQCAAFVLLFLPVVLYGEPLSEKAAKTGCAVTCLVFWAYLAVFGGLMGLRQTVQRESKMLRASSMDELMSALDSYAKRDVFDPAPYQLEYVATAVEDSSGQYDVRMLEYVEKIRNSGNYPSCSGLPRYYYLPTGDFKGLFECSRECLLQRASYVDVWNGQAEFYREQVLPAAGEAHIDEFAEGVLAFQALLEEVNQSHLVELDLTEENRAFVDLVVSGTNQGLSGSALYEYLTAAPASE